MTAILSPHRRPGLGGSEAAAAIELGAEYDRGWNSSGGETGDGP